MATESKAQQQANALQRTDALGGTELSQLATTVNAEALAAREEALVKSRVALAIKHPRVIEMVEKRLVADCNRPGFADSAWYKIPKGTKNDGSQHFIEGFTVRFAEAAMRHMGNLDVRAIIISEDAGLRVIEVMVMDLESNVTDSVQFAVNKTQERKHVNAKDTVLAERLNSFGEKLFIIPTTEMDLLAKTNAMISRARRTKILEMVPADVREVCAKAIAATILKADKSDPDARKDALVKAFAEIGVTAKQLTDYLRKPLADLAPVDFDEFRGLLNALKQKETTWGEVMQNRNTVDGEVVAPAAPAAAAAPAPKASPQKTAAEPAAAAAPSKPTITAAPGTLEYAQQVFKLIEDSKTVDELRQLAGLHEAAPKSQKQPIADAYAKKLDALQKAVK